MITQKADVEAVLKIIPQVEVNLKLFVEEDDDSDNIYRGDIIVEKDIMTLRVTLTRNNVAGISTLLERLAVEMCWLLLMTMRGCVLCAVSVLSRRRNCTTGACPILPSSAHRGLVGYCDVQGREYPGC